MEKHTCHKIIIEEIVISMSNKNMFGSRRAITRNETQLRYCIVEKVMKIRSDSFKISTMCLCDKFEVDLMSVINEANAAMSKTEKLNGS